MKFLQFTLAVEIIPQTNVAITISILDTHKRTLHKIFFFGNLTLILLKLSILLGLQFSVCVEG